jgi:hypothetical protein
MDPLSRGDYECTVEEAPVLVVESVLDATELLGFGGTGVGGVAAAHLGASTDSWRWMWVGL